MTSPMPTPAPAPAPLSPPFPAPLSLPDAASIRAALAAIGVPESRFVIDVRDELASTNSTLVELAERGTDSGTMVLAHRQRAGRGRRGRVWFSQPGHSLTFSLLWRFAPGTVPSGLSLAVGVALVRALAQVGAGDTAIGARLSLKWPNDILLDGRKLAGVLIELVPGAPQAAVIGIGLNLRLPAELPPEVRELATALPPVEPARLLACLLKELGRCADEFTHGGFAALRSEWQRHHVWQDQPVRLFDEIAGEREGICRGVDIDGALLLETATCVERVLAGDVSLRGQVS